MIDRAENESVFLESAPETPFMESLEYGAQPAEESVLSTVESPFLTEYQVGDEVVSAEANTFRGLLDELFDSEFDESLEDLIAEAAAEADRLGTDESPASAARAERVLDRWIDPLRSQAEAMFDGMAEAIEREDPRTLNEDRLDEILAPFEPRETGMSPTFENFAGKLFKKAKALAKKAKSIATKFSPIHILMKKVKGLVRPLLDRVLKAALNKLPPTLRPVAAQLAKKFLGQREDLDEEFSPASVDVRSLQLGFDAEIATLALSPGDLEQEELVSDASATADRETVVTLNEYHEARDRFVAGMESLEDRQDPTPLVEEFIPAILPALKLGISMVGRPKVVGFIAGYVAKLIAPYVGQQVSPALSKAIVDAGLRLISLETPETGPQLAAEAFSNVIEDTVRRLSELSDEELEDENILEAATYEAAQEAIAANFPNTVLSPTSEFLETSGAPGAWVGMPRGGKRPRYRKYTRVVPVTITPTAARDIHTFGGKTLAQFLRDHLGQSGVVKARLHLYQAVPGTRVSTIARSERTVSGLGSGTKTTRKQIHPLTREAAAMLSGEPGLGRELDEDRLDQESATAVGDRFYYLEVAGARPVARTSSGTNLIIDTKKNELRLAIFVAESEAQQIAARLRRREPIGAMVASLRRIYQVAIRGALKKPRSFIKIVGEAPETEGFLGGLKLGNAPMKIVSGLIEKWVGKSLVGQLLEHRDAFIKATAEKADGVTIIVKIQAPPGLSVIAKLLRGGTKGILGALNPLTGIKSATPKGPVKAIVEVRAGRHNA
jgi:hypothetical protein